MFRHVVNQLINCHSRLSKELIEVGVHLDFCAVNICIFRFVVCALIPGTLASMLRFGARALFPVCEFFSGANGERTLGFLIFLYLTLLAAGMDTCVIFARRRLLGLLRRFRRLGCCWRCPSLVTSITVGRTLTRCSLSLESLFIGLATNLL